MDLDLTLRWKITLQGRAYVIEPAIFELLRGIRQGGHLNFAAKSAGLSYRHAWGLLREWESRFGSPLIVARRGRGAHLTELGEAIIATAAEVDETLSTKLERVALDAASSLSGALEHRRQTITIASSQNETITALRETLSAEHKVSLAFSGSESALNRYQHGEVDVVGFHLPMGRLGRSVAADLINLLEPSRDLIRLLDQRQLGFVSSKQAPVVTVRDLTKGNLLLVNRQRGSVTRRVFDALLDEAGIAASQINGYEHEEYTHTAVAALVASGGAEVALATAEAAATFKLHFEPVVEERFYVAMAKSTVSSFKQVVAEFSDKQDIKAPKQMKSDEIAPSVATLKRVHNAGFWKD